MKFKNILAISVLCASLLSPFSAKSDWYPERHRKLYGTLKNPKYTIKKENVKHTFPEVLLYYMANEKIVHQSQNKKLQNIEKTLDTFLADVCKIDEKTSIDTGTKQKVELLENISYIHSEAVVLYEEVQKIHDSHIKYREGLDSLDTNYMIEQMSEGEQKYGSLETKIKQTVENMIGKKFPEKIDLAFEDQFIIDDALGYHLFLLDRVAVLKSSYSFMFYIALHEMGHVFAQHQEDSFFNPVMFILTRASQEYTRQISVMEEASAFAFANASVQFLKDAEFKKEIIDIIELVRYTRFSSYTENLSDVHNEGYTLADAAMTYLNDPIEAYNYLATTKYQNIDSNIWQIVENNRNVFCQNKQKIDDVYAKSWILVNKSGNLLSLLKKEITKE